MEIEARRKKEIVRKNTNFAKQYREKIAERKKSQDGKHRAVDCTPKSQREADLSFC